MKVQSLLLSALAICAALTMAVSCDQASNTEGKPYKQLPEIQEADKLAAFKALPASVLPKELASPEKREAYFNRIDELFEGEGEDMLGGENCTSDNSIYWTDYFNDPDNYDFESDDIEHPHFSLYLYQGVKKDQLYCLTNSGSYKGDIEKKDPEHFFLFDKSSGKIKEVPMIIKPEYTQDTLVEDPIITYGSESLYYSLRDGKFYNNYFDSGFNVSIEDVGDSGVRYDWNGVCFVRNKDAKVRCIYNFGFANIQMGNDIPWNIPGYTTSLIENKNLYGSVDETTVSVVRDGETEPTLIVSSMTDFGIEEIEVCDGKFSNIYGIYPGMPVSTLYEILEELASYWEEKPYISVIPINDEFVAVCTGTDEDFYYKVPKDQYRPDETFTPDAKVARVVIVNAVG